MRRLMVLLALVCVPAAVCAQSEPSGAGAATVFAEGASVLNLMSAEQFAAAGLGKLSPAELRALSNWVRSHSLQVAELARTAALNPEPAPSENPGTIETRMDGDFTGWDGGTIFQLANGQTWRQISFGALYHFQRAPKVTLVATGSGWRLQVAGVPQSIYVKRVR